MLVNLTNYFFQCTFIKLGLAFSINRKGSFQSTRNLAINRTLSLNSLVLTEKKTKTFKKKNEIFLLIPISVMLLGVTIVTPTDKGVTLTLHTHEKSWNEAQAICAATGGNLFSENSPEKQTVFAYYQQTAEGWTGFRLVTYFEPDSITNELRG